MRAAIERLRLTAKKEKGKLYTDRKDTKKEKHLTVQVRCLTKNSKNTVCA